MTRLRRIWCTGASLGVALAAALAASSPVLAQVTLDAYKCYKAKDLKVPKFDKQSLNLSDQFGINDGVFEAKKPFLVCNPSGALDQPLVNPVDNLVCYKVKGPKLDKLDRPRVEVGSQLGTTQLEVVKPFVLCVPSTQSVLTPTPASGSFFALTYNVAGLPEGISGSHPETNTPIMSPLLNAYDLVLVQESWQTPDPNPLAPLRVYHELLVAEADHPFKSVSAPLPIGSNPARPSALVSDGLNRMSRLFFATVARRAWTNCHASAADCLSLKGFSMARTVLAPGFAVDVYNLHMEAGGDAQDDLLREEAVTQMGAFMAEISPGNAIIVGGDFNLHTNSEPDSTTFQRLLSENDLTDACAFLGCPDPGRIDKFLFRNSDRITITPTSWELEDDVFVDGLGDPLSDHLPVAVNFSWAIQ